MFEHKCGKFTMSNEKLSLLSKSVVEMYVYVHCDEMSLPCLLCSVAWSVVLKYLYLEQIMCVYMYMYLIFFTHAEIFVPTTFVLLMMRCFHAGICNV